MSNNLWQRWWRGGQRREETPAWCAVVGADWPERIMEVAATDDFHAKQGRSTGRWLAENGGRQLSVYLKRHYRLPWWSGLLALLWPRGNWSPAFQEWRNLTWAVSQGFRVPAPVAAAEYIGPGLRLQSVLAVEELEGMLPLHQAIPLARRCLESKDFLLWKRALILELARVAGELHRRRRYHKDLYLCHFYLPRADIENWTPQRAATFRDRLHLIDLHRLAHHPWTWPLWQWKDLAQLLFSSELEGVTARDQIMFWRLYRGATRRSPLIRVVEWFIGLKWRRYRDHNRKLERRAQRREEQKKVAA